MLRMMANVYDDDDDANSPCGKGLTCRVPGFRVEARTKLAMQSSDTAAYTSTCTHSQLLNIAVQHNYTNSLSGSHNDSSVAPPCE